MDLDSPRQLYRFYGISGEPSAASIEDFFRVTLQNAVSLFAECGVKATFFAIGEDVEASPELRRWIEQLDGEGHEIANHSYSHPFGFSHLDDRAAEEEIDRCSAAIERVTGKRPTGFRAPGYDVSERVLDTLERRGFAYDSSAFFNTLTPLAKLYHWIHRKGSVDAGFGEVDGRLPRRPYFPSRQDLCVEGPRRGILELPLPRSRWLNLPCYGNFHLSTPGFYRRRAVDTADDGLLIYLFHLIEFGDLKNGVPDALSPHPNAKTPVATKLQVMKETIGRLKARRDVVRTQDYVHDVQRMADAT